MLFHFCFLAKVYFSIFISKTNTQMWAYANTLYTSSVKRIYSFGKKTGGIINKVGNTE